MADAHTPEPSPPAGIAALHWTDEWKPTAPTSLSAREAAVWILADIDWASIIEEQGFFYEQMDPVVYYGLRERLFDVNWVGPSRRWPDRLTSHLTAWVTSRLKVQSWCVAEGHADDMIPFNDCWHGDDPDSPCQWSTCWALLGDPQGFLGLALTLIRDGWEAPDA